MAKYWEDWSGSTLGNEPTGWTKRFNTSEVTYTVQDDSGSQTGRRLRINRSSSDRCGISFDAVDSDGDRQDAKVRVLVKITQSISQAASFVGAMSRAANAEGSETALNAMIGKTSDVDSRSIGALEYTNGSVDLEPLNDYADADRFWNAGDWYWIGIDVSGTSATITLRTQADPSTVIESLNKTVADRDGWVGIFQFASGGEPYDVAAVSVATGADDAFYEDPNADTTAPTLTNETASSDGTDGYSGSVDTDEGNGTLYHVVTQSATSPSATQVKNGNDDTGSAADASGNQAVSATGTQNVGQTGVLSASTTYYVHYMHEDSSGNQSTVASTTSFTTDSSDTTAPTLSSATVDDAALTLTYNESLDESSVPATGDFTVTGSSSGAISVSNVGVSGTDVNLTLASAVEVGETVDLDYTPGTNPIQDTAGNDAASLTDEPVTNNTTDDLTFETQFDGGSCHPTNTTITDPGTTSPTVHIVPRATETSGTSKWRQFFLRLTSADSKRPVFTLDDSDYVGSIVSDWQPWFTEDDPESESATWTQFDTAWSTNGSGDIEWQHSTAFTASTVHVAFMPGRPVAREKALIDWLVANHPTKIHRLPSIGDDANWSGGTLSDQTDELSRTVPGQPMYAFGLWDSTSYPSDNLPKRTVLLTANLHAGEHLGGFMLEGAIRWLVGGSAAANALLQNIQFIVMPCTNPMGRYGGHDRAQWDPADLDKDPNRDWVDFTLESTQKVRDMLDEDSLGRTFIHHIDFHTAYFDPSTYSAPAFHWEYDFTNSTYLDDWETLLQNYDAGYVSQSDSISTTMVAWSDGNRSAVIALIPEALPQYAVSSLSDWEVIGEHWLKTLNDWWDTYTSRVAFAGNYVAETLNGSATVSRQLDAAVYPWPPKPADTPVKVERGLGADAARNFRMDMGGTTGDVFVVLSSVDYEAVNDDAAAGANKVTVQST